MSPKARESARATQRRKSVPSALARIETRIGAVESRLAHFERRAFELMESAARQQLGAERDRGRDAAAARSRWLDLSVKVSSLVASALAGALASYLAR